MSVASYPSFWTAIHDFVGDSASAQLSFKKGDTFLILEEHESGWFTAERNRERGYVPGNYFSKIEVKQNNIRERSEATTQPPRNANLSGSTQFTSSPNFEVPVKTENREKNASTDTLGVTMHRRALSNPKPKPPIPTLFPSLYKPNQKAAPPIPLRKDLGEVEIIPEVVEKEPEPNVNFELLQKGKLID